jgi:sensor c-di-GMP phosphodiesterase-like protein
MRKLIITLAYLLIIASLYAQSPEKISYQAIIRNSSNHLVTNQDVGMRISILEGSTNGTPVYLETQKTKTNANGLVSVEIGTGKTSDDFSAIDWAKSTYFIKTETDTAGGQNYTIAGISQILSVPYALHAKTAETLTGEITETDPAVSANFDFSDAANGDLLQFNGTKWVKVTPDYISDYTVTEEDIRAYQAALAVTESQITDLKPYLESETDPAVSANFDFSDAANGDLLQFNGTKWVKVTPDYISDYTVTEEDVRAHQAALAVTESQITDLKPYLESETDPAVSANFDFSDAANGDLLQFNGTKWVKVTPDYISDYTVTEEDVRAHQAALAVTESQITDLKPYLESETDPAVSANFDFSDAANGDLLQFNGTKWVKVTPDYISDYTVTEEDVRAHQAALAVTESQITDLKPYLESETDPAVSANFDFSDAANGDLLQFNGTKWVKVTPDYISDYTVTEEDVRAHQAALAVTESQITDLKPYLESETDPAVSANFDFSDAANGDLLQFNGTKWVKVTPDYISDYTVTEEDVRAHQAALAVTESQITDLKPYLESETDPAVSANFDFSDAANGDLLQFNGTKWVKVTPDYISDYTVTEEDVRAHQAALAVTESQITDLKPYLESETDPAVSANFDFSDAANGDLLQFNGTKWVKVTPDYISDYTVTEEDVRAHQAALAVTESQITDLKPYLESETDPAVSANFDFSDAANGDLLQFNGTKWVKVTPDYISDYTVTEADVRTHEAALVLTESQITDLKKYLESETDPSVVKYSVGDWAQGGVVFWVDETGQHGLVASKWDLGYLVTWYNGTYLHTEAHGKGVYAGKMNTTLIVAKQGHMSIVYAAGACASLKVGFKGVLYGDWYLPSIDELNMMYNERETINATALANGGRAFEADLYWSSTEENQDLAYRRSFVIDYVTEYVKDSKSAVRPIRAF